MSKINFSDEIKLEIIKSQNNKKYQLFILYGVILSSNIISKDKIELKSNIEDIILFYKKMIYIFININVDYEIIKTKKIKNYIIRSYNIKNNYKIIKFISNINDKIIDKEYIKNIIKGIFIVCGNIYNPQNKYYLEFLIYNNQTLSKKLQILLNHLGFDFRYKTLKRKSVIYMTNSNLIEDFLTYIGATKATLEIINTKIYKNLRNKVNRLVNCETSNINKVVSAASYQIKCINKIINKKGINYFDNKLKEIALKRLKYPEMSLNELLEVLSFNISKSGLNHRLKKIEDISNKI